MSAGDFLATSAGMNGRTVGLPVQAVVCTQNGQWAETPSRLSLALANASLISLALLQALVSLEHVIRRLRAGSARFLRVFEKLGETLAPCCAPSMLGWKQFSAIISQKLKSLLFTDEGDH